MGTGVFRRRWRWAARVLRVLTKATGGTASKSVSDSGTGSESVSVSKTINVADSATGVDTVSRDAILTITDAGGGTEAVLLEAYMVVVDAATGAEVIVSDKLLQVVDAGAGAEAVSLAAEKIITDLGEGVDSVVVRTIGAAEGPLAAPAAALRLLLASSSTFQTLTGTGSPTAAEAYVFIGALAAASFTRPGAGIEIPDGGWRMRLVGGGASAHFAHQGELRLAIELDVDPADADDPEAAEAAHVSDVEDIIGEMLALAGTDDYLAVDEITLESGPSRSDTNEAPTEGDYYRSTHTVRWGGF